MHSSLTLRTNLMLIASTAVLAVLISAIVRPVPWVLLAEGVVAGIVAGVLQRRSLGEAPDAYRSAHSSQEVRAAMMSTKAGKLGVYLQWGLAVVLLVTGTVTGVPLGAIAGYAAFMCARDATALPAVLALGR